MRKKTTKEFVKKAEAVHGNKYNYSKVRYVNVRTKVKITCRKHGVFEQTPGNHLNGKGCPECMGVAKPSTTEFVKEAKAVHGNKYDYSKVRYVNARTKVKIICPVHGAFFQTPNNHLKSQGCSACSGKKKSSTEDFTKKAEAVHGNKYNYSKVRYVNVRTKVKIICLKQGHGVFEQTPGNHLNGNGCPKCGGSKKKTIKKFVKEAKAVHGNKYDYSKVRYVNALTKVKIICLKQGHGVFEQTPGNHLNGKGCPCCRGWNLERVIKFVKSLLLEHNWKGIPDAIKWTLFEDKGIIQSRSKTLNNNVKQHLLSPEFLEECKNVDEKDIPQLAEKLEEKIEELENKPECELLPLEEEDGEVVREALRNKTCNKIIDEQASLGQVVCSNLTDKDKIKSFIKIRVNQIWNDFFLKEKEPNFSLKNVKGPKITKKRKNDEYYKTIVSEFKEQLKLVKKFPENLIQGYNLFLMQKLIPVLLEKQGHVANWSETGSGKTISAIAGMRYNKSMATLIIAPESTRDNWEKAITQAYGKGNVEIIKTLKTASSPFASSVNKNKPLAIITNHEQFQKSRTQNYINGVVEKFNLDFVVVDEFHKCKGGKESIRVNNIGILIEKFPEAKRLVMSATPVINESDEGVRLVELLTGENLKKYKTGKKNKNVTRSCANTYVLLSGVGIRDISNQIFEKNEEPEIIPINIDEHVEEIFDLIKKYKDKNIFTSLDFEYFFIKLKLPTILNYVKKGTIIYTEKVKNIVPLLKKKIERKKLSVGVYTGENKKDLPDILNGKFDVLIMSKAGSEGTDGLQKFFDTMIFAILPWTSASMKQIKARIARLGQENKVKFYIPICEFFSERDKIKNKEERSRTLDQHKWDIIKYKRNISDACIEGVLPGKITKLTKKEGKKWAEQWLKGFEEAKKNKEEIEFENQTKEPVQYREISLPLAQNKTHEREYVLRKKSSPSDFDKISKEIFGRGYSRHSTETHQYLQKNPDVGEKYLEILSENQKTWNFIPYRYMAKHFSQIQEPLKIVDAGAGNASFAEELKQCSPEHQVFSYDHIVSKNNINNVVSCDISKRLPLKEKTADDIIFSCSLRGENWEEYLIEAERVIRNDRGRIHIIESVYRIGEMQEKILELLSGLGFSIIKEEEIDPKRFFYICATKKY